MNQSYIRRFIQVIEFSYQNVASLCRLEQTGTVATAGLKNVFVMYSMYFTRHI